MPNQMPGQLRVDNQINGQPRVDTSLAPLPGSGVAEFANGVAQQFAAVGERVGQMADKAAAKEGALAGNAAGLDPEFRPMRTGTIRGDAFDRAGLDVAETRLRQQIDADFDGAFLKHGGDAKGLQSTLTLKRQAILANAPEELRPGLDLMMRGKSLQFSREQARKAAAEAEAAAKGAIETQLNDNLKGLHQRAYGLGLDAEADKVLANDVEALRKTLERRGPAGQRLVSPEAAAKHLDAVQETVTTARLSGAFQRLPTLEAKAEFIQQFEKDFAGSKGLAKIYDLQGFDRVKGQLEADLRVARVERGAQTRAITDEVTEFARMAEKGFAPAPDAMAGLKSKVLSASDPDLQKDLAKAEAVLEFQQTARRSTPAELEGFIRQERTRMSSAGATSFGAERVDMAEKLLSTMRTELKQDPLGWADRTGVIKIAPLDVSAPEKISGSVRARIAQAEEVAALYGQEPKYLQPAEVERLAAFASQGSDQMLVVSAALAETGGERAPQMLREIFDKAPGVAMLGGHVSAVGMTPIARDVANGMALQKVDGFKARAPSAQQAVQAATTVTGDALAALPKSETAAIALANAAYEVRARQLGLTDFNEPEWQKGLRQILGERAVDGETFGGVADRPAAYIGFSAGERVIVPPNIKTEGFFDLVDAITLEDLTAVSGVPLDVHDKPASTAMLRRARLSQAGDGRYFLDLGDGEDRQTLKTARGDEYVLDMKLLEPLLRKRRPDLYLSGGR